MDAEGCVNGKNFASAALKQNLSTTHNCISWKFAHVYLIDILLDSFTEELTKNIVHPTKPLHYAKQLIK